MKRQNIVRLGATVAMLSLAACFSDPTKSLRSGPSLLVVTNLGDASFVGNLTHASVDSGATLLLGIQVQDNAGNYYSFSAPTVGSNSSSIATFAVLPDSALPAVPGNTRWKALLTGVAPGSTTLTIQADGVMDTVSVTVN